jgi:hypothetical protein
MAPWLFKISGPGLSVISLSHAEGVPLMVKAHASILIERPADAIYGCLVDDFERNYKRWSPEVQRLDMLTPGPLRVGTRARQVRVDQGRRTDTTFQVQTLERPRRVCFAEVRDKYRIDYGIEAVGEGPNSGSSRLTFGIQLTRLELHMRPFEKLIRAAVQEGAARTVRNIKQLVEAEIPVGGSPPTSAP